MGVVHHLVGVVHHLVGVVHHLVGVVYHLVGVVHLLTGYSANDASFLRNYDIKVSNNIVMATIDDLTLIATWIPFEQQ